MAPKRSAARRKAVVFRLLAASLAGSARATTIFTAQAPAPNDYSPDLSAVEIGVRFRADVPGRIMGLRFYKLDGNTGVHYGHLWTNAGSLLRSVTFAGETASGWQTAAFSAPIAISSGTTYVASYHTTTGYAVTRYYFRNSGVDNPPLHALRDGVNGPDGSYTYSSASAAFPTRGTRSSNYWVDVVFSVAADTTPPTATILSPPPGALLRSTVTVTAYASDNVAVSSVQFKLDGFALGPPNTAPPYATVWNTALSSDGPHVLTAVAWDTSNNASTSAPVAVTVRNTPPAISAVSGVATGTSSGTVSWLTDEPATSQVVYGTSAAYGSATVRDSALVTTHTVLLSALASGTTYHFAARSTDAAGNTAVSSDNVFSTIREPDITPPAVEIASPTAGAFLRSTVTVTAAASDNVAVSSVQFQLDGFALGPPNTAPPYATVWNTALSSDGPHVLTAVAWDTSNNASTSAPMAVTVRNAPPAISALSAAAGASSATVTWLTDEPATSQVDYGTSAAYGISALDPSTVTIHNVLLSGLLSGTTYHFRARSVDAAGNVAVSSDGVFTTLMQACVVSSGPWINAAFAGQISSFTVSFDATPSASGIDASIGLSSGAAGALGNLAAAVRFTPLGYLEARYSVASSRMNTIFYSSGVDYHFDLRVNVPAHLYDVYVTAPGAPRTLLARDYTFRAGWSTSTTLNDLGASAAAGGSVSVCNLAVAPSTTPWWDGVRELYATAVSSKTWYSSWDNGINRTFGYAVDPTDPWFDAAHGNATYSVDAASGVLKISGSVPRMYIHDPTFVKGSNSGNVPNACERQWRDVEITVYGMRVADNNTAYAGLNAVARSNHGVTGSETTDLCDTRGVGARFRNDGRLDFEKEIRHPATVATALSTTSVWGTSTRFPFNVWVGYKHVVYDLPNGDVKVENYMDMTNGAAGGNWILVNQFEDNGANWGDPSTSCSPSVSSFLRLTGSCARPGSESGLPNVAVYFRSDGVGTNGLLYKKASVREIVAPTSGLDPPKVAQGRRSPASLRCVDCAPVPALAPEDLAAFSFRDAYAFPNPSRRGAPVTIRLQAGVADEVAVDVFDVSGRRVGGGRPSGPAIVDDGNGKGPQFTYDFLWDVGGVGAAVYRYSVKATKTGEPEIRRTGKVAIIK